MIVYDTLLLFHQLLVLTTYFIVIFFPLDVYYLPIFIHLFIFFFFFVFVSSSTSLGTIVALCVDVGT
jgi:hypothetical protein